MEKQKNSCGCEINVEVMCSHHWFEFLDHPERFFKGHLPDEACDKSCRHASLEKVRDAIHRINGETPKEAHQRIIGGLLD